MASTVQAISAEERRTCVQVSNDIATRIDQLFDKRFKDDSSTDFSSQGTATPTETQSEDGDASVRSSWKFNTLAATPHETLTVKHTFIHVDADEEENADTVRACLTRSFSMPSFPSCEDRSQAAELQLVIESQEENHAKYGLQFAVGDEVVIDGLVRFTDFNGRHGVVLSWNEETCRFDILLSDGTGTIEERHVTVKPENLTAIPRSPLIESTSAESLSLEIVEADAAGAEQSWPSTPCGDDANLHCNSIVQPTLLVAPAVMQRADQSGFMPNAAPMWQTYGGFMAGEAYLQPDAACAEVDWWTCMSWAATDSWQTPASTVSFECGAHMPFAR